MLSLPEGVLASGNIELSTWAALSASMFDCPLRASEAKESG